MALITRGLNIKTPSAVVEEMTILSIVWAASMFSLFSRRPCLAVDFFSKQFVRLLFLFFDMLIQ
ncbi:hypothetical protein, partial [Erwinia amylovora]|uniref:hypothetical protein n=1 Tax=Erwinia amylovora TaxID=552 RepID=UPI0020BF5826